MRVQLYELARPFPDRFIKKKPGAKFAADYVDHGTITARLLEVCGPFDWTIAETIRDGQGRIVGCLGTLTVEVDGRQVSVTEVGDCEHPQANDASNLKAASSDALKRCAMRLGLGLHLWVGDGYFLDRALKKTLRDDGPDALIQSTLDGELES